ncbi:PIN domain-like protein [Fomitiporia mediterranea MF3/22]|uniref:PIN domain-like protein n=1 Tax=Fomitiporia mediterranea (strain MF3/22) TaxID=694068 RepID=UPI0004408AEC|nr:PIN domain-like protein [Fomitiporia mediterranea MF3/22]EJD03466.1 PIN domain-like protein [Fomitiporia mediterranea MF3/22]
MGIQGLLPLLKPIQRRRHLSDFSGQTLAVDAYVWLHRGAYSCATELVQGRPTRRYVDFCMARVRLLRHHGILPYLVFDGGPLPAKLGTEKEREKKREQNIKRANELMSQGKESQARELYVKCVDVTPQMAYQVIKALKAENVPYVVAPYEADAQLAYLERMGLVDGIITEDSDLLVFGCRNVHVKLDTVSASVVSISRADFGSPSLAADSFSLIGWSDAQFRWMAMLSGCDYLPSIAGIGLKTAYQLLKKYKTVEKAVRMIRLDGKKSVPKDYVDAFFLAEKVFLHQRVYDPCLKKLVYLTSPSNEFCLSEEVEMYIGRFVHSYCSSCALLTLSYRDLEPSLATRIAEGDTCPISLNDMDDINPSFVPRPVKALPLQQRDVNSSKTPKGKEPTKKTGILNFFSESNNVTGSFRGN